MTYTQAPVACEKNIFHLFCLTQPVKNYSYHLLKAKSVPKSNLSVIMEIQSPAPGTRCRGRVVPVVFLASPVTKEWVKSTLGRSVGNLEEAKMPLK